MWSYTLRRALATLPTLLVVITVCYLMLHATPGGPFDGERKVSAAVLANLQAKYHLDLPLWQQYLLYLKSLLQGDLGASFRYADWSVNDLVANAMPVSLAIGGGSMLISLVMGVGLGIVAALRQNSVLDHGVMLIGNIGSAFPSFVIGPVLIMVFAVWLKWLPAGGWDNFQLRFMVLPVALLTQASKMIMDDYPMIPLLQYSLPRLVKAYVGGYSLENAQDRFRSKDLYIIKH